MIQRGRKSTDSILVSLAATAARPALTAPRSLGKEEARIFALTAAHNKHLSVSDAPLLAAYCTACVKTAKLAKADDVQPWERSARVMTMLARSLRLTPQSSQSPKRIGVHRAADPLMPAPWAEADAVEEERKSRALPAVGFPEDDDDPPEPGQES